MSETAATEFLDRVETDDAFAKELESVREHPDAVIEKVHEAGFDATPEEIMAAFTERYGVELTPEQLDMVAAGTDPTTAGEIAGGSIAIAAVLGGLAAIAAGI